MAEDTGTNTALVVLVVILIAALFAVIFFQWGRGGDEADAEFKVRIEEGGSGSLILPERSRELAFRPAGLSFAGMG